MKLSSYSYLLVLSFLAISVMGQGSYQKGGCYVNIFAYDAVTWTDPGAGWNNWLAGDTDLRYRYQGAYPGLTTAQANSGPFGFSFSWDPDCGALVTTTVQIENRAYDDPTRRYTDFFKYSGGSSFSIQVTSDLSLSTGIGIFSGSVIAYLDTVPSFVVNPVLTFTITIDPDPCVLQKLNDLGMNDMYFQIREGQPATEQTFLPFQDTPATGCGCGLRLYKLEPEDKSATTLYTWSYNSATHTSEVFYRGTKFATLVGGDGSCNPTTGAGKISVQTTNPILVGFHTIVFTAQMKDFPRFNPVTTIKHQIVVHIDARCHYSYLEFNGYQTDPTSTTPISFQPEVPFIYEYNADPTVITKYYFFNLRDKVSLLEQDRTGYSYCGPRRYKVGLITKLSNCGTNRPSEKAEISLTLSAGIQTGEVQSVTLNIGSDPTLTQAEIVGIYQVDFYVQLENYQGFGYAYNATSNTHGLQMLSLLVEVTPPCSSSVITFSDMLDWDIQLGDSKSRDYAMPSYNKSPAPADYCNYCGDLEIVLVDDDNYQIGILEMELDSDPGGVYQLTLNLVTDSEDPAHVNHAQPILTTGNNFSIVSTLRKITNNMVFNTDIVLTKTLFIEIFDCPLTHQKATTPAISEVVDANNRNPYFYVIRRDGAKNYPFAFLVTNADCDALDEREFLFSVNGTAITTSHPFLSVNAADIDAPLFVVNSDDVTTYGSHEIQLWSRISNLNPLHPRYLSTDRIDFSVVMYGSNCLWRSITPNTNWLADGTNTISFTIEYLSSYSKVFPNFGTTNHDPSGHARLDDCTQLKYTLISGSAFTKKILSLNSATRTLTLNSLLPEFVGTWTATMSIEYKNHPWLTYMKKTAASQKYNPLDWYIEETVTVVIDAVCDTTTLLPNPSFIDLVTVVGEPTLWYQFENTNDTYTVENTPSHEFHGWAYCKERKYTILGITNITTPTATLKPLSPPIVEVDFDDLFIKVNANDNNYFGIFEVTIQSTLYRYKLFNAPTTDKFKVYILPHCSTTSFKTFEPLLKNMSGIVVNQTSIQDQRAPHYVTSIELLSESWGFGRDTCGELEYWLESQNKTDVPAFITLQKIGLNERDGTYEYLNVNVKPTQQEDAGEWLLNYCVGLKNQTFITQGSKSFCTNFTVFVEMFPEAQLNNLPFPRTPLENITMNMNESHIFELWPEDAEQDPVITTFSVLTPLFEFHNPNCVFWNKETLQLTFFTYGRLQNTTVVFQVCYRDPKGIACYQFHVDVLPDDSVDPFAKDPSKNSANAANSNDNTVDIPNENTQLVLSYSENMVIEFANQSCGYLLSGLTFPRRPSDFDCIRQLQFPLAVISEISETGLVQVNFTYEVPIRDNLHNTLIAGMIECSYINKAEGFKKKGVPQQIENLDFSQFLNYRNKMKIVSAESDDRRLAVLTKDEFAEKVDFESEAKKSDFNWTITSFTNEYMTVQLKFAKPSFISTYEFDQIEFSFNRTYYDQVLKNFNRTDLIEVEYNYTIKGMLPPQIFQNDTSFVSLQRFSTSMFWITAVLLLLIILLGAFSNDALHYFWQFLNFMQLLVHLPLLQVPIPASTLYLIKSLFPWGSYTEIIHGYKHSGIFSYTGTPPFAVNFDYLGYEGRHQIVNLGTVNWLICLAVGMFLLSSFVILLAKLIKPSGTCYTTMMKYQMLPAVWFRMFLQLFFVILLCSLISLSKPKDLIEYPGLHELPTDELTVGDQISKISTAVAIAILGAFTAFMVINACFNRSFTAYKFAKMEALAATDILFAFRSTRAEIIQKFARLEAAKGFTQQTLKDRIKKVLLKNQTLESQLHLQSAANYQARLIRGRSDMGFDTALHMQQVKLDRIAHLNEARNRFEARQKELSFWTGKWTREIRKNLKQSGFMSISFWHFFLVRRMLVVVSILFLFHKPVYQITLFAAISFVQLLYLCFCRPFVSDLKNCMEFYNELVIYVLSFCFIGSEIAQSVFSGDQFATIGFFMCLLIEITIIINLFAIGLSLIEPFRIAIRSRSNTGCGRLLRFLLRKRLPTIELCNCPCCTCKEDRENTSLYPRSNFFSIQTWECKLLPRTEGEDSFTDEEVANFEDPSEAAEQKIDEKKVQPAHERPLSRDQIQRLRNSAQEFSEPQPKQKDPLLNLSAIEEDEEERDGYSNMGQSQIGDDDTPTNLRIYDKQDQENRTNRLRLNKDADGNSQVDIGISSQGSQQVPYDEEELRAVQTSERDWSINFGEYARRTSENSSEDPSILAFMRPNEQESRRQQAQTDLMNQTPLSIVSPHVLANSSDSTTKDQKDLKNSSKSDHLYF